MMYSLKLRFPKKKEPCTTRSLPDGSTKQRGGKNTDFLNAVFSQGSILEA
jgi:hypothetical protein